MDPFSSDNNGPGRRHFFWGEFHTSTLYRRSISSSRTYYVTSRAWDRREISRDLSGNLRAPCFEVKVFAKTEKNWRRASRVKRSLQRTWSSSSECVSSLAELSLLCNRWRPTFRVVTNEIINVAISKIILFSSRIKAVGKGVAFANGFVPGLQSCDYQTRFDHIKTFVDLGIAQQRDIQRNFPVSAGNTDRKSPVLWFLCSATIHVNPRPGLTG